MLLSYPTYPVLHTLVSTSSLPAFTESRSYALTTISWLPSSSCICVFPRLDKACAAGCAPQHHGHRHRLRASPLLPAPWSPPACPHDALPLTLKVDVALCSSAWQSASGCTAQRGSSVTALLELLPRVRCNAAAVDISSVLAGRPVTLPLHQQHSHCTLQQGQGSSSQVVQTGSWPAVQLGTSGQTATSSHFVPVAEQQHTAATHRASSTAVLTLPNCHQSEPISKQLQPPTYTHWQAARSYLARLPPVGQLPQSVPSSSKQPASHQAPLVLPPAPDRVAEDDRLHPQRVCGRA